MPYPMKLRGDPLSNSAQDKEIAREEKKRRDAIKEAIRVENEILTKTLGSCEDVSDREDEDFVPFSGKSAVDDDE